MSAQILLTSELPGRTLTSGNREYLYFSGTSYLGMARNQEFQTLLLQAINHYGLNYSSSRLSNVQLAVYALAEDYLAAYTGAPAALTVSSGLLAGQLVVKTLTQTGACFYGPRTHPALWQKGKTPSNQSFLEWASSLPAQIAQAKTNNIFILCNSVDPLMVQKHDLTWLRALKTDKNITVIVDDSHGLGVTGPNGTGIYLELVMPASYRLIVVGSLGKALGIPGGVILADSATVQQIHQSPLFGSASPVVPAYLDAFLQAAPIYAAARMQLFRNINYFLSRLHKPALWQGFPGYPVFYTPYHQLYAYLLAHDVLISSFAYPTPDDQPITRIVLNSLHTYSDIDKLTNLLNDFAAEILPD